MLLLRTSLPSRCSLVKRSAGLIETSSMTSTCVLRHVFSFSGDLVILPYSAETVCKRERASA